MILNGLRSHIAIFLLSRWEHFHVDAAKRIYEGTAKRTNSLMNDMEKELAKMENYNFLFKQVCISYRFYSFFPDSIQIRWASCRISLSARNFPGI